MSLSLISVQHHCAVSSPLWYKNKTFMTVSYQFFKYGTYFASSNYWSSTTNAGNTDNAWNVNSGNGNDNANNKTNSNYVRCVRAGE